MDPFQTHKSVPIYGPTHNTVHIWSCIVTARSSRPNGSIVSTERLETGGTDFSVSSLQCLGLISVSASYVSFTTLICCFLHVCKINLMNTINLVYDCHMWRGLRNRYEMLNVAASFMMLLTCCQWMLPNWVPVVLYLQKFNVRTSWRGSNVKQ